jgi:undecaprenyl-diphosphatase
MTPFQAIVLGFVQGATEFLPISSTAHLALVPWLFGWTDPGLGFDIALHLGTLMALLLYFRADWFALFAGGIDLLRGRRDNENSKLMLLIMAGTAPALIVGAMLADFADSTLRKPPVIASALIVLAVILLVAERVGRRENKLAQITLGDAIAVGCAQAVAIIPGASRSGVTITAALFRGMTREAAARFSFLLSAPVIIAAVSKTIVDGFRHGFPAVSMSSAIMGIVVSGVVGYLSIAFLIRYLATHNTYVFVVYRIALGIAVLAAYFKGMSW